jgi:hypothetical protein
VFLQEQTRYESVYLPDHIRFVRAKLVVVGVSNPNHLRQRQAFSVLRDGYDHPFFLLPIPEVP